MSTPAKRSPSPASSPTSAVSSQQIVNRITTAQDTGRRRSSAGNSTADAARLASEAHARSAQSGLSDNARSTLDRLRKQHALVSSNPTHQTGQLLAERRDKLQKVTDQTGQLESAALEQLHRLREFNQAQAKK